MTARELTAPECRKLVDPSSLRFGTTEDLPPLSGIASQERALTALSFGLDIRQARFHVVVVGASGTGRTFSARSVARRIATTRPTPDDVLLLPNPRRPSEPTVLSLPAGEGRPFVEAMEELYTKLVDAVRGATEGERFKQVRARTRRRVAGEESRLEEALKNAARALGLELVRSENEVQITSQDESVPPSTEALSAIAASVEEFETTLATVQDGADVEMRGVMQQLLADAVRACFAPVRARYEAREAGETGHARPLAKAGASGVAVEPAAPPINDAPEIAAPAPALEPPAGDEGATPAPFDGGEPDSDEEDGPPTDRFGTAPELGAAPRPFVVSDARSPGSPGARPPGESRPSQIARFLVDVETVVTRELRRMVDEPGEGEAPTLSRGVVVPTQLTEHAPGSGAPVVEVPYPTLGALFGRTHAPPDSEFPPEPGFAVAGALHEANGGFLILAASALLKNDPLYEQLKACLLAGKFIVPEHNPSYYRGTSEELLFPPIPIDVKVVLIASPQLYQELHEADPEFSQLFKVQARFEPTLSLAEALLTYPSFLAGVAHDRGLPPLTADAVSELLFHGGRLAESQTKVTAQLGLIAEVATEAGYRALQHRHVSIDGATVVEALAAARRRGGHFRDHVNQMLSDGTIRIETEGERVGQVNAISVLTDGPQMFGRPCRVTAVVYPGVEGPVNIAREVEMSGPLHSKGVLVLAGFLAARLARERPMMFGASLVFEQTYEAIDGDSASSSELYALLSALSGFPLRQDLAVTGSVDQQGSVQPVGGLNEKIEAFYDLCLAKGLTGRQGVLMPVSNRDALMLRTDVVEAIETGRFHVHAIATVEEGIGLLTGVPAGVADDMGHYPDGTVFRAAETKLKKFHHAMMELARGRLTP